MFTRLYLHIPFCRRKCPYCAFVSRESAAAELDGYTETLLAEMRLAARAFGAEKPLNRLPENPGCSKIVRSSQPEKDLRRRSSATPHERPFEDGGEMAVFQQPLKSVYFGGGTPSLLAPSQVARLLERAASLFGLGQGAEITLEANPGTVDRERLAAFRSAGVNRLSLGVQSFADPMLAILGRIHSATEARDAFRAARAAGFDNIGIDLIHALPGQTLPLWRTELEQALALRPEHISVYGLTVEEGTPFAVRYGEDSPLLPDEDLAAAMFEEADDLLTAAGYEHYEIANYALPGRRSDHNSGYWHRDGYLGLGCGAHSFLRQGYGVRFGNPADLDAYTGAIAQGRLPHQDHLTLTRQDAMAEFMFLGLRMADGIEADEFEREFGVGLDEIFGKEVSKLTSLGLLGSAGNRIRLTRRGMLLSNQVFSHFL